MDLPWHEKHLHCVLRYVQFLCVWRYFTETSRIPTRRISRTSCVVLLERIFMDLIVKQFCLSHSYLLHNNSDARSRSKYNSRPSLLLEWGLRCLRMPKVDHRRKNNE